MTPYINLPDSFLDALQVYFPFLIGTAIFSIAWFTIKWAMYLAWKAVMVAWKAVITVWKIATDFLLSTVIMPIITWIKDVVALAWDGIVWLAQKAWDGLQALGEWFKDIYEDHIKPALDELYAGLKDTWEELQQVYKDVISDIQYVWDHSVGLVADLWTKVKAAILTVADLVGIIEEEWATWIRERVAWVNENIFSPLNDLKTTVEDFIDTCFDWMTDSLDMALSKIDWLKDIWDNHITPLKFLIIPTIEAPQLLGKETCVTTTITYGEEVADALDGSAWVRPDAPTIVKMGKAEGCDVIDYFASEIMLVETGKFAFALDFGSKFAKDILKLEIIKAAALTAGTLDFLFPGRKTGEKKVQELMKD